MKPTLQCLFVLYTRARSAKFVFGTYCRPYPNNRGLRRFANVIAQQARLECAIRPETSQSSRVTGPGLTETLISAFPTANILNFGISCCCAAFPLLRFPSCADARSPAVPGVILLDRTARESAVLESALALQARQSRRVLKGVKIIKFGLGGRISSTEILAPRGVSACRRARA